MINSIQKTIALLAVLLFAAFSVHAQQEKLYLDQELQLTTLEKASYYYFRTQDKPADANYYYLSGQLYREAHYINNKVEGEVTCYYTDGKVKEKMTYEAGMIKGQWKSWYHNGQPREQRTYSIKIDHRKPPYEAKENIFVMDHFWDSTGVQQVKDGKGEYNAPNEYRLFTEKGVYEGGKKQGEWKGYYDNGELYYVEVYEQGELIQGKSYKKSVAGASANREEFTYKEVRQLPAFEGGMEKLMKFLSKNIKYPPQAQRTNIQGTVYTIFTVTEKGKVENIRLLSGIEGDYGLNEESLRVLRQMPDWNPAIERGQVQSVDHAFPIKFKLNQ